MSPLLTWVGLALPAVVFAQQAQPNPCFRWSGQVAIANSPTGGGSASTLWYQGGEARTSQGQTTGLWTNALVSLDLSKDWTTGSPPLTLVQADSGNFANPPAVALGALWASNDGSALYQYGGEFSDSPNVAPPVESIYRYSIANNSWATVPTTGDTITRTAEGSTALVPSQGSSGDNVGYFFSGHLDDHTVNGWSASVPRVYLSSMVQFDLGSHAVRNISSYAADAATSNTSTPEISPVYRADGTLTYVPGLGTNGKGLLVAIGGATESQYVDNSVLDVYDIGAGGWTKQATLGDTLGSRLNHCAVRASAKVHGVNTHQIFIYGGQQLNQSDRDSAMYILTIPSYTWTFVGNALSGQPAGRAGHQCVLHGSQMIVMGGYLGDDVICDQPGVYVYDVSKSAWASSFTASSMYSTPAIVANVTGGIGTGTSSSGFGSAAGGDGSQDPDTSGSTNGGSTSTGALNSSKSSKSNLGAIVGGVVGGVLFLVILALLVFWLVRRRKKQKQEKERLAAAEAGSSGSQGELQGFPYEKTTRPDSSSQSNDHSGFRHSGENGYRDGFASDDVEEETRGMEASFGSTLIPKRTLRVVNPEETLAD